MPKHLGKSADATQFNNVASKIASAGDASAIDTSLGGVPTNPLAGASSGNTSIPVEQYNSLSPDIETSIDRSQGFSSSEAALPTKFNSNASPFRGARGANLIDLANLSEANMMDIPQIVAKSFDIAAMLQVAAKDPSVRFRWVNFKNNEGGNYQMFKSIGFTNAVMDDVDQQKTPIGENIIRDGGELKYYDVILMKVNVIRLMQAYKANVIKSLEMVGRWSQAAQKEAQRTFNNEVSPDIVAAMKQQGLSVDFYIPSKEEFNFKDSKGNPVEA